MNGHVWGTRSLERLATVEPKLRQICHEALRVSPFDLTVLCGRRSREEQEKAVAEGRSKVHWPKSRHNCPDGSLSQAVDLAPFPIDWHETHRFVYLAGIMHATADRLHVRLRWGGNWDGDGVLITDQHLVDLPHYELC